MYKAALISSIKTIYKFAFLTGTKSLISPLYFAIKNINKSELIIEITING